MQHQLSHPLGVGMSLTANNDAIAIVYTDYETDEGEKAFLGSVRRMVTKVGALDAADLGDNLAGFCRQMG